MTTRARKRWLPVMFFFAVLLVPTAAPASESGSAKIEEPATASRMLGSQTRAARPIPRGSYQGRTSQGWAVNLKVSSDRRRIIRFSSSVTLICRISGSYRADRAFVPPRQAAISPTGAFALDVSEGDGRHYKYRGRFVSSRRAGGTLTMGSTRIVFGGVEVCVTPGRVTWTVTIRG